MYNILKWLKVEVSTRKVCYQQGHPSSFLTNLLTVEDSKELHKVDEALEAETRIAGIKCTKR